MPAASLLTTSSARRISHHTEFALAALVVSVVVMMVLPLPPWLLDMLVALNICLGVMLLLTAMFVPSPLAFSSFPSVLLITTLLRISLNVATTRQILLHGDGGDIIDAFGHLVVGGNLVVGLVVFLIITIVQFIVVAKGAERVAEVSARFTLDALPGKQMSIDADLRAGVISQGEAFRRRSELVQESQFYGSMDGAMKFVKGDAIAGMVIVIVNLLGGVAIGTLWAGMTVGEAVHRYAVLSIGDGLVSQVPALLISIAAGITITRTASSTGGHLGTQIAHEFARQPRSLMLSAIVMGLFALVPGFPAVTFIVLALGTAVLSRWLRRHHSATVRRQHQTELPAAGREGETTVVRLEDGVAPEGPHPVFCLELSSSLLKVIGVENFNHDLLHERARLRDRYGIPFPGLRVRVVATLPDDTARIVVQDLADLGVRLPKDVVLAVSARESDLRLIPAELKQREDEPVPPWLLPGTWLSDRPALDPRVLPASVEILPVGRVLARLLMHSVQRHAAYALGVQEVRQQLRALEWRYADLIREAMAILPLGRLADLMAALARERVPLNDLPGLLQSIVTHGPATHELHLLYESVRLALARSIVARLLYPTSAERMPGGASSQLPVIRLDAATEGKLREALIMRTDGPVLALSPEKAQAVAECVLQAFEQHAAHGTQVLLLPTDLRRATSRLLRGAMPRAAFLSDEELLATRVDPWPVGETTSIAW